MEKTPKPSAYTWRKPKTYQLIHGESPEKIISYLQKPKISDYTWQKRRKHQLIHGENL